MDVKRLGSRWAGAFLPLWFWVPVSAQVPVAADAAAGSDFGRRLSALSRSPWTFQASGLVGHFREPRCQRCEYRTSVPGLGLERELRGDSDSAVRYSIAGGLQSDSFGRSGGYVAAVASRVIRTDTMTIKPGLGGFAFYRFMEGGGGREVVPAILPVLGIEAPRSGVGATLLVAPNFSYGGSSHSGFVFLQLTYRLAR